MKDIDMRFPIITAGLIACAGFTSTSWSQTSPTPKNSTLKSLTDTLAGMGYDQKAIYMRNKLDTKGYFTPYKYVYTRFPDALPKGRETILTGFRDAISCMNELETRQDMISKVCVANENPRTMAVRRQPTFKLQWFENNPTCHSIQAYFLADEKMLITKRDDSFADWSDTGDKIVVTAPNSRGGYHTYIYNKTTNTGEFLRKESIPTRYDNCMDASVYEATR